MHSTSIQAGERTLCGFVVSKRRADWLLFSPSGRLLFGFSRNEVPRNGGWVARLNVGSGAGYRHGFTLFAAFRSGSRIWVNRHRGGVSPWSGRRYSLFTRLTSFEIGATRNFNAVPHTSH